MRSRISLLMAACIALAAAPSMAGDNPDLRLEIRCYTKKPLLVGDEILILFRFKVVGDTPHENLMRHVKDSRFMEEYQLAVFDAANRRLPDPHGGVRTGGEGSGPGEPSRLRYRGDSFWRIIALNRWAIITKPGKYRVVGIYDPSAGWNGSSHTFQKQKGCRSEPITITVGPRSPEEMSAHIESLAQQLGKARDEDRRLIFKKFMYTCDDRIVPVFMEELCRGRRTHWASEAYGRYLPDRDGRRATFRAARGGLSGKMFTTLTAYGCSEEQIRRFIRLGLSEEARNAWPGATLIAPRYPDDANMPRLAAIATGWRRGPHGASAQHIRVWAIQSLAQNRTEVSVKALRELLEHGYRWVREDTKAAIVEAYRLPESAPGRRLLPSDFPELHTQALRGRD